MVHQGGEAAGVQTHHAARFEAHVRELAISCGVNVLALSRMLGHTSAKITLDTYADLFDTDLDAVAAALDLKCAHCVPKPRPVGQCRSMK